MRTIRSFFNGGILRQNLRQSGWIGILYLLGLMFVLPLQLGMREGTWDEPIVLGSLYEIHPTLLMFFVLLVPVGAGLLITRYMQVKASSDLIHSLPLKRSRIYLSQWASGSLLLLPPIWITTAVTAAMQHSVRHAYSYDLTDVWRWGLQVTVFSLLLYSFTFFVGVCTGQTIFQGAVVYILLLLPAGFILLLDLHFSTYLYGYSSVSLEPVLNENISPVVHMTNIADRPFGWWELLVYAGLAALFTVAGLLLYRKRHAERATQATAFTYFDPIFQLGVMLCAMLVSGSYFLSVKNQATTWSFAGYIIGALLGFTASEMIIRKSWLILNRKAATRFAGYTVVLGIVLIASASNLTGFETRVPSAGSVESVYYQPDHVSRGSIDWHYDQDPAYIEAVRRLHRKIVDTRPAVKEANGEPAEGERRIGLIYRLKDGSKLARNYTVPVSAIQTELKPVMESVSYKNEFFDLKRLDDQAIRIEIHAMDVPDKVKVITDPAELQELQGLLKQDMTNMTYEEQVDTLRDWGSLELLFRGDNRQFPYEWKKSYHAVEEWLVRKGYADEARITAQDVRSMDTVRYRHEPREVYKYMNGSSMFDELMKESGAEAKKVVQNKEAIAQALANLRNSMPEDGVLVRLVLKDGSENYGMLDAKDAANIQGE